MYSEQRSDTSVKDNEWDDQIADDLDSGRLDALLAEVDEEYELGLARPLQTPCHKHHAINGTANQRGR